MNNRVSVVRGFLQFLSSGPSLSIPRIPPCTACPSITLSIPPCTVPPSPGPPLLVQSLYLLFHPSLYCPSISLSITSCTFPPSPSPSLLGLSLHIPFHPSLQSFHLPPSPPLLALSLQLPLHPSMQWPDPCHWTTGVNVTLKYSLSRLSGKIVAVTLFLQRLMFIVPQSTTI